MSNWWQGLNPRERGLIGIGLPVLLGLMFYFYLWQPVYDQRNALRNAVPEKRALLAWMEFRLADVTPEIASTSASEQDQPLLTIIERVAISAKIADAIQRVQPSSGGAVEIWYQEAVADNLLRWLDQLAELGIAVESATIAQASEGKVSARVKLARN